MNLTHRDLHLHAVHQQISVLGGHLQNFTDGPSGLLRHIVFQQHPNPQNPDHLQGRHGFPRQNGQHTGGSQKRKQAHGFSLLEIRKGMAEKGDRTDYATTATREKAPWETGDLKMIRRTRV